MASCVHCHRTLPPNDVVEAFPFGRRVAYDPERLRYWAVCGCGKWTIAPLEENERAAAIDQFERWWSASSSRYSTDGIGVGQYSPRFSLVRIGESTWDEFASWRYARTLLNRRKRYWLGSGVSLVGLGLMAGANMLSLVGAIGAFTAFQVTDSFLWRTRKPVCRVPARDGSRALLRRKHIASMELPRQGKNWTLLVRHDDGANEYSGPEAVRVLGYSLPILNFKGAKTRVIADAMALIREAGGPEGLAARVAEPVPPGSRLYKEGAPLLRYSGAVSVALEMAMQEQNERRMLENELALLRAEWLEAEQIASLASLLPFGPSVPRT